MLFLITLTTENINAIVGWASTVVGDMMPLLIVIFGIAIGIWVITAIFHLK